MEACWAHNSEVGRSKLLSAKLFCTLFHFLMQFTEAQHIVLFPGRFRFILEIPDKFDHPGSNSFATTHSERPLDFVQKGFQPILRLPMLASSYSEFFKVVKSAISEPWKFEMKSSLKDLAFLEDELSFIDETLFNGMTRVTFSAEPLDLQ